MSDKLIELTQELKHGVDNYAEIKIHPNRNNQEEGLQFLCDGITYDAIINMRGRLTALTKTFRIILVLGEDVRTICEADEIDDLVRLFNEYRFHRRCIVAKDAAMDKFWRSIADSFPEIKQGKITPDTIIKLDTVIVRALREWVVSTQDSQDGQKS